jgi:Type ISP C-terminal specificity domain/N-6 DNA Methylase
VDALETYFAELSANRTAGAVPETSGYGALQSLLNEIGHTLKPRVRCVINPASQGAGIPDGGLYVANQFEKQSGAPLPGQLPARGAIEVKPASDSAAQVAESEQVRKYLEHYRQVLVTTYREFVLVGYNADGERTALERFSLAETEVGFWVLASTPRKSAAGCGERLTEFLKRVLLRQSQIVSPQELAWFLASYAREARARAEERDLPNWNNTRVGLEEALGMSFEGEKGEHFFRSTLVQTLFYGLFAAWVFWAEHHESTDTQVRFRWREAAGYLHIPILQKLFYDFSQPGPLGALRIDEVLDWAAEALNRVDRASFFATFALNHAVQYFYEPFLEAFDPELRKELGVWYTPPEIVQYMVERVDQVLRSELGITDGLADPSVVVLDPCCGTGAYLVEVLNRIAKTAGEKGDDALLAHDLKQAAMGRIYGFEILPAPFVISHLQIGMLLHRLGAPFDDDSNERAGVYLTNALTGWDPPREPKQHLLFTEMEEERDKAEAVKQHQPILVILGNPPYNIYAGAAIDDERDLVEEYRSTKRVAPPQGRGLNDLYVRFFRMAERRITEGVEGRGIVCFISNYSWLDGLSFTGMRERFLEVFDHIWIDCLNGDKYKTGKLTPDGDPDPSVFSTEKNREGIQVGTAITLLARSAGHEPTNSVSVRDFWGRDKKSHLVAALASDSVQTYAQVTPALPVGLPFVASATSSEYLSWPRLTDLFLKAFPGLLTSRDDFVIDVDRSVLEARVRHYFDPAVGDGAIEAEMPSAIVDASRFHGVETRRYLLKRGFLPANIVRYAYRPFDNRWIYWEPETKLLHEKRSEYFPHIFAENIWIEARQRQTMAEFDRGYVTKVLGDSFGAGCSSFFPLYLHGDSVDVSLLEPAVGGPVANLSTPALVYLDRTRATERDLFDHVVGLLHGPAYRRENAGALRQDWPRIPLPATADALHASAELGRRISALLEVESPVDGVSAGQIGFELRPIGSIAKSDGSQIDPAAGDLAVTAGWGHAGQGGVTMPGRGRVVERPYSDAELAGFREGLEALGLTSEQLTACLGGTCVDVYLNERAYWRCVPKRVWTYTIGGYQVMKKWLSYRERPLLGRDLKPDEARYVTEMARRIAAILLLEPALDANYERVKADAYAWPGST